jgi:hypothetical protein
MNCTGYGSLVDYLQKRFEQRSTRASIKGAWIRIKQLTIPYGP